MFMPKSNDGDFAPPPSGTHVAVCNRVIDLGTQKTEWQGQTKLQRKILISWELPEEKMDDGRPFTISQRYTFSSSEKAKLRKDLESWRGKRFSEADLGPGGFDIKNILGKGCLLSIVHTTKDGKTYANIDGVMGMPKGSAAPNASQELVYFSLERERFERGAFDDLSDNLKATIKNSPEFADVVNGGPPPDDYESNRGDPFNDDIPF